MTGDAKPAGWTSARVAAKAVFSARGIDLALGW